MHVQLMCVVRAFCWERAVGMFGSVPRIVHHSVGHNSWCRRHLQCGNYSRHSLAVTRDSMINVDIRRLGLCTAFIWLRYVCQHILKIVVPSVGVVCCIVCVLYVLVWLCTDM